MALLSLGRILNLALLLDGCLGRSAFYQLWSFLEKKDLAACAGEIKSPLLSCCPSGALPLGGRSWKLWLVPPGVAMRVLVGASRWNLSAPLSCSELHWLPQDSVPYSGLGYLLIKLFLVWDRLLRTCQPVHYIQPRRLFCVLLADEGWLARHEEKGLLVVAPCLWSSLQCDSHLALLYGWSCIRGCV